jgi:hypothetical protein
VCVFKRKRESEEDGYKERDREGGGGTNLVNVLLFEGKRGGGG